MRCMNASTLLPEHASDPSRWDSAMHAFLAEKERRSGSRRTVEGYSRMLVDFFGRAGRSPDRIASADVLGWAHGIGLSGRRPSSVTIGARIACLSSFFRFLIRMGLVAGNPCDALERPRLTAGTPRGLDADQVRRLLATIPDDVPGQRDHAIVLTGRRKSEVLNLKATDCTNGPCPKRLPRTPSTRSVNAGAKSMRRSSAG